MQPAHVMSQMMCITFTVSWVNHDTLVRSACVYYVSTFPPICLGEEYRQSIDPGLLAHCMVHCAHNALVHLFTRQIADNLLSDLFTQGQITVHNCKAVYLYMVYELSTLL